MNIPFEYVLKTIKRIYRKIIAKEQPRKAKKQPKAVKKEGKDDEIVTVST